MKPREERNRETHLRRIADPARRAAKNERTRRWCRENWQAIKADPEKLDARRAKVRSYYTPEKRRAAYLRWKAKKASMK